MSEETGNQQGSDLRDRIRARVAETQAAKREAEQQSAHKEAMRIADIEAARKWEETKTHLIAGGVVVTLAACAIWLFITISSALTKPSPCGGGKSMAYIMSQNFVKRQLKSPSTAQFPLSASYATEIGECHYAIRSYVDAQNAFGGTIRNRYSVEMKYQSGDKTWQATNLRIDE